MAEVTERLLIQARQRLAQYLANHAQRLAAEAANPEE